MTNFNVNARPSLIKQLKDNSFDVLIIGGGVTGAGALLDAQSRGLNACLIEMQDFSQGTSSRSTKLIHGGLRYLKQGDLKLVAEVGKERNVLYKNAPHLTQPTEVIIPFIESGSMGKFSAKLAMIAYEWLAKIERKFKHKMLSKREILNLVPHLKSNNLKGGVIYFEFKTNDSRLVIENIKKANTYGAIALNYLKATGFVYKNDKIEKVQVTDLLTNESFEINTSTCISAVGPWTDAIMQMDNAKAPNKVILTKGVHIAFEQSVFPLFNAVYYEVGDGRMIFAIPKFDKVYVGTTDTFYTDDKANPSIDTEDVDYIINSINKNFNTQLSQKDVIAAWAGLRPLVKEEGKGESEISRKDEVFETDSNLIAIAGGKLTGYRKMAEKVVDMAVAKLTALGVKTPKSSSTQQIRFLGFDDKPESSFISVATAQDITPLEAEELYHWFGRQAYEVLNYQNIKDLPSYLGKSLSYCYDNEMVTNPIDFLIHRTQLAYFDLEKTKEYLPAVYHFLHLKSALTLKDMPYYLDQLLFLEAYKRS
jgi:glycerol-3-phosphate dehydrogenase